MRRPYALEDEAGGAASEQPKPDKWKERTRIHLIAGLSVQAAKRVLDDATFDPERAQLVRLPSKELLASLAADLTVPQQQQRPRRAQTRPGPKRRSSTGFQVSLLLMLLLALALQLYQLKFAVW